jgi:hypothetical protein
MYRRAKNTISDVNRRKLQDRERKRAAKADKEVREASYKLFLMHTGP